LIYRHFWGENLQDAAYPEIIFCYIAQKFAYFILPHIVLYFIFRHGFFVGIVLQRAHEDAHLFCLYFFSCHVLCLLFCFNAQADYYFNFGTKKKDFHFTAPSKGLFCFNALVVKLYFIVSHHVSLVFFSVTLTCTRQILPPTATYPPPRLRPRCCRHNAAATMLSPPPHCRRHCAADAAVLLPLHFPQQCCRCDTRHASAAANAALSPSCRHRCRRLQGRRCTAVLLPLLLPR
jgi:hypothetical protein